VLDINGQLKWKKDYGYDAMGKTAVLDDGDERFVVLKKRKTSFLNFESGEIVRKESPNRIIASADFSGDGHREVLVGLAETDFAIWMVN
jgi:oligoribonuclease NrnB/cAMP/cGMP phosphodiesterase (DHH superfamily)